MIKNNKGFMLIEVIVTSTIVLTVLIGLYTSFSKTYNNYRHKNTYYNLDASYATQEIIDLAIETETLNLFINKELAVKSYGYFIKDKSCYAEKNTISSCKNLQKLYKIDNSLLIKYDIASFNKLKTDEINLNQTLYDYIDYLINYYDLKNTKDEYSYIVVTEINDHDNYYYASIRLR